MTLRRVIRITSIICGTLVLIGAGVELALSHWWQALINAAVVLLIACDEWERPSC